MNEIKSKASLRLGAAPDSRPIFHVLDSEQAEQETFNSKIASAADKAARYVDLETIGMFRDRGIPLPTRLAKIAESTDIYVKFGFSPSPEKLVKSKAAATVKALRKVDSGQNYKPSYSVRYQQDMAVRGVK